MSKYTEISKCRISGSTNLINVLSLGNQHLTGVFPKTKDQKITAGPLDLVWCPDSGLLQLKQSYSLEEMYGDNYGYRSGLNQTMVRHLKNKIKTLERFARPSDNDLIIDIGSNDATSLKAYSVNCQKVGIDPTGKKFLEFYTQGLELIPDFFSAKVFQHHFKNKTAKIITSIGNDLLAITCQGMNQVHQVFAMMKYSFLKLAVRLWSVQSEVILLPQHPINN